jgi:long-subunit fatty acid transport protein
VTRTALLVTIALSTASAPSAARAGTPVLVDDLGGPVFTGPTSAHVTAGYWNPAAAGLLRGWHVFAAASARFDWTQVERTPIDPASGEPSGAAVGARRFASVDDTTITPSGFLGVTRTLTERVTFGVSVFTPSSEAFVDDPGPLRYQAKGGALLATFANVFFSYNYKNWWFGGGVGLVWVRGSVGFSRDENLEACDGSASCNAEDPAHTSDFFLTTSTGTGIRGVKFGGYSIGLLWRPRPALLVGAAYQSSPGYGEITTRGTAEVTPSPASGFGPATGDAELRFELPQAAQIGVRWDAVPGAWQILASARWIDLSVMDVLDVRMAGPELRAADVREWVLRYRGLRDVLVLEAGAENPAGGRVRLGARLRFSTGSTATSQVSAASMDRPSLGLAAGAELGLGGGFSITLAASGGATLPATVTDSAFSPSAQTDCVASGYDLDRCAATREGRAGPTAAGDYLKLSYGAFLGLAWDRL